MPAQYSHFSCTRAHSRKQAYTPDTQVLTNIRHTLYIKEKRTLILLSSWTWREDQHTLTSSSFLTSMSKKFADKDSTRNVRNLCIAGHVDHGKVSHLSSAVDTSHLIYRQRMQIAY